MPSRWRRCESINPAGPAPTIPTWVRSLFSVILALLRSAWPARSAHSRARDERMRRHDPASSRLVLAQRRGEIGDEIVGVLNAHGEAHQGVADAPTRADPGGHRAVRHKRGMLDQAFAPAETLRQGKQPAAF